MRSIAACCLALLSLGAALPARGSDYQRRLERERAELRRRLLKKCPDRKAEIASLASPRDKGHRKDVLGALAPCGKSMELYWLQTAAAHFAVDAFKDAERCYREALRMRVTESAQVGLLTTLVRMPKRSPRQTADLREHLEYFRRRRCTRSDLCAGLAYVAWHLDEYEITKRASQRAIKLGFSGWQPYFFAGTVYALGNDADRKRARELLIEAKRRSGPKVIDDLLQNLGR